MVSYTNMSPVIEHPQVPQKTSGIALRFGAYWCHQSPVEQNRIPNIPSSIKWQSEQILLAAGMISKIAIAHKKMNKEREELGILMLGDINHGMSIPSNKTMQYRDPWK